MPTPDATREATLAYFKARYGPLYRYADGVETMGLYLALGGGVTAALASLSVWGERHGGLALLSIIAIAIVALAFVWACQLLASAVRAFTDIAVSQAPGLDAPERLAIIRGSGATPDAIGQSTPPTQPRELTDIVADVAQGTAAGRVRATVPSVDATPPPSTPPASRVPRGLHTRPAATPAHEAPAASPDPAPPLSDTAPEAPSADAGGPAAPEATWYLAQDGASTGPWTEAQLRQGLTERSVTAESLVWRVGEETGWVRLDADVHLRRALRARR